MKNSLSFAFVLTATIALGCGDDKGAAPDAAAATADAAAPVADAAPAAGDRAATGDTATATDGAAAALLDPPPPGKGIQISMTTRLMPGEETERCMFYRVAPEGLNVVNQQIKFTPGSHHFLVYSTTYKEIPTKTILGQDIDTRAVFDCGTNGPTGDWETIAFVAASQNAQGDPAFTSLPPGTALKIPGGSVLLVNTHYLNASDKALETTAAINMHTIPAAEVTQEAGILFFYNRFIRVPGRREATARLRCPILRDITVLTATSHMHKRGMGAQSGAIDPMTGAVDPLFETKSWADVPVARFSPGKSVKTGQLIDLACRYKNDESRTILQGLTTRDEMCVFGGLYYPRHLRTELCSLTEDGLNGRFMGGLWVGEGTLDGKATETCIRASDIIASRRIFPEDKGDSLSQCVTESCPRISRQVSDAVRCWSTQGLTLCGAQCVNAKDAACKPCLETVCGAALMALSTAACQ